ncbi:type II toxin-antitoxin system RelE/ParE family toxin [Ramlibacter sp.]|uniref:type II toxin-antitoxin system RelE/ParE family toxin n=1 Tax=Ramlibacter sp. TaxID=1917967 RepID=UPI003D11B109
MDEEQRVALLAAVAVLEKLGPAGGRPLVGTLRNPEHPNMKELRYNAHENSQVWRAAFAFDPQKRAIVLVAGEKQGRESVRFYELLLKKANRRLESHLRSLRTPLKQDRSAK